MMSSLLEQRKIRRLRPAGHLRQSLQACLLSRRSSCCCYADTLLGSEDWPSWKSHCPAHEICTGSVP